MCEAPTALEMIRCLNQAQADDESAAQVVANQQQRQYYYYVDTREDISKEFTPCGVWQSLSYACRMISRGLAPNDQKNVVQLYWRLCSDWLPTGRVLASGIETLRGMRAIARSSDG